MTALTAARPAGPPLSRWGRLRTTAAVGGLAVLLSGSVAGHLAPTAAASSLATGATSMADLATGLTTGLGLTSVTGDLGAVARTGGRR